MNEAVTQDVQEESTLAELTTAKSEELLTEALSEPIGETTVHLASDLTENVDTTVEPEIKEITSTETTATELKGNY